VLGGWAAEAQNALYPFAMLWYFNQGPESEQYATDDYQHAIAAGAGLDLTRFDQDRASPATQAKADAALAAARAAGFTGTPTFVVSGPGGKVPFLDRVPTADTVAQAVAKVAK
jgi:protein-disulfide isomerase